MANTYSSNVQVLAEAGMAENENFPIERVNQYREEAQAEIKGNVALRYKLTAFDANFTGSQASGILRRIEILLAAGWVLSESYGTEGQDTEKDGGARIDLAHSLLDQIVKGESRLFDSNNLEYAYDDTSRKATASGSPSSSEEVNQDGEATDRKFKTSTKW